MLKIRLFLFFSFLVLLSCSASSLSWKEVSTLAKKNNPEIIGAQKKLDYSKWGYYRSFSSFIPQVSANASYGETTSGTLSATSKSTSYGLSVSQSLFSGMDNYYSSIIANNNFKQSLENLKKSESDVLYKARSAYLNLAIAIENIKLQEKIVERRKTNSALIKLRYESGREDKGVLLGTQADESDAIYALSSAKRELELARLKLSQLVGVDILSAEASESLDIEDNPAFDSLLKKSPGYNISKYDLDNASINYRKTISGFLPSVSLSGSYRKSGSDWPPENSSNSWSLNVSYQLFPGGSNIADTIIYGAKYEEERNNFKNSENDFIYNMENAYKSLKDSKEALDVSKISLKALAERSVIANAKYLNGLIDYDEWIRIENEYIASQKNVLARRKAALLAEASWHNSYGGYVK